MIDKKQALQLSVAAFLVIFLVYTNLTKGSFRYAPTDGCSCEATYSTKPVTLQCEETRKQMCGYHLLSELLVASSIVDFNK